jgi:hypothetical protein
VSPKRPPSKLATIRPPEWNPNDTQALRVKIDLAQETEWRRTVADQIEAIAKTLGDVRDTAREAQTDANDKAGKTQLTELSGKVDLLTERVGTLKHVTWGVLVVFVIAVLLEKKGML